MNNSAPRRLHTGRASGLAAFLAGAAVAACCAWAPPAVAHTASRASLQVQATAEGSRVQWEVAWRDLDALLDLDADGDERLTWREARAAVPRIEALAAASFDAAAAPHCRMALRLVDSQTRGESGMAVLRAEVPCPPADLPLAAYQFLAGVDASHRLLVAWPGRGPRLIAAGESPAPPAAAVEGLAAATPPLFEFVAEGVRHILRGPDHVIFVLTLVLPLALVTGREVRSRAARRLLWVVSSFTLAHTLTLAAAALDLWRPPAQWVEPAIALSIAAAAVHNLLRRNAHMSAALAFACGLLHGFGFAELLVPLALPTPQLAAALALFNLGIELGQLLVLAPAVLLLSWLQRRPAAARTLHTAACCGFAAVGVLWFAQRLP
ncbi:HupE/UreJ family protein [Caldimonas brevitalea]|uniref:Membrane protein n=1 Tax=Caldimonas brevitalea TaxID=413882 RepID=A0A0G3BL68_9BURK|nr:HupE/UreJ family protein [Caldimonas brevitalea]AKJ30204.1 membrane protein [Caldimonas brevitalea]